MRFGFLFIIGKVKNASKCLLQITKLKTCKFFRFVIVKQVRKDLIHDLPLPQRLKDYLSSPHYYSEQVEQCMSSSAAIEGTSASPEAGSRSPCLRHSTQSKIQARFASPILPLPSSSFNLSAANQPAEASRRGVSLNLRFNNLSDLGATASVGPSKRKRTRDRRLSSSHSSLENNTLWPLSPSTLSNGSNSAVGRTIDYSKKTSRVFYGSSHSSPSSPAPLDYSPPDWLSSSEDVFQIQAASLELPPPVSSQCGQGKGIRPDCGSDGTSSQRPPATHHQCICEPSASSSSSLATSPPNSSNGFVLYRTFCGGLKVSDEAPVSNRHSD